MRLETPTKGYRLRGKDLAAGAVVAEVPDSMADAERSVCGRKGFMIDEERVFSDRNGRQHAVSCARVACLEITDSPVHVHDQTVETYHILSGTGRMVLDKEIREVRPGSLVLLPQGVQHGLMSDHPDKPVRVLMHFTPGLAPLQEDRFRDETILWDKASQRIRELEAIA